MKKDIDIPDVWIGSILFHKGMLNNKTLIDMRNGVRPLYNENNHHMINGGWHFSFIGNPKHVQHKVMNFGHWAEFRGRNSEEYIQKIMDSGEFLKDDIDKYVKYENVDNTYPICVKENLDNYKHIIKEI